MNSSFNFSLRYDEMWDQFPTQFNALRLVGLYANFFSWVKHFQKCPILLKKFIRIFWTSVNLILTSLGLYTVPVLDLKYLDRKSQRITRFTLDCVSLSLVRKTRLFGALKSSTSITSPSRLVPLLHTHSEVKPTGLATAKSQSNG